MKASALFWNSIKLIINDIYVHQIKGTAMETKFAFAGSNLVVAYIEIFIIRRYLHYFHNYIHKILSTLLGVTTFSVEVTFFIND